MEMFPTSFLFLCVTRKKKEEWHSYCGRPASNNEKEKRFFEAMPL